MALRLPSQPAGGSRASGTLCNFSLDSKDLNFSSSAGAAGWKWMTGLIWKDGEASRFFWLNRLTLCSSSGLGWAEPFGLGWARGAESGGPSGRGRGPPTVGTPGPGLWPLPSAAEMAAGSGRAEGLGLGGSSSRGQRCSPWRSPASDCCHSGPGARAARGAGGASELALTPVPSLPSFRGTSTEKRSDETLGWWMSMAAVVTTHTAGLGTPLSASSEVRVTLHPGCTSVP